MSLSFSCRLKWIVVPALLVYGCSAIQLPEYTIQPFANYEYKEVKEDLAIAIQPFTGREDVEKQFGTNLLSEGILPVLLIAENRSSGSSYVLSKERVALLPGPVASDRKWSREEFKSDSIPGLLTLGTFASLAGGVAAPAVNVLALPLMLIGNKMEADANAIKYNLAIKELHTRTVSTGRSVSGFLYFKMPEKGISATTWTLHIEIVELKSKRFLTFNMPFEFHWGG